jgi:sporulation-control protein spo0M
MFEKVKQYFGIEGVKINLVVPEEVRHYERKVNGLVHLSSMNRQVVQTITVKMMERYTRGRGNAKRIDEYELGKINLDKNIEIVPDTPLEIEFTLSFELLRSEVETFGAKNFIFKGIANAAKLAYGAQSEFFIEAEAKVKGTALPPFVRKKINLL